MAGSPGLTRRSPLDPDPRRACRPADHRDYTGRRRHQRRIGSGAVRPARWRRVLPAAIIAIMSVGWLLLRGRASPPTTTSPSASRRLSAELGSDGTLPATDAPFALSQDGTVLAFVARRGGGAPQLHVRHLDQLTATPLDGTAGASSPFFSTDGQWVAFFADLKLKKIPVTGGAVVTLADAENPRGGWWAEDNTIVFAPHYRRALMRVSAVGGHAQPLTRLAEKEITHRWPRFARWCRRRVHRKHGGGHWGGGDDCRAAPAIRRAHHHQRGGYFGRYVASGHIVYVRGDTLYAIPFDPNKLTVTGAEARAIEGVSSASARGAAQFAVSQSGTLTYLRVGTLSNRGRSHGWIAPGAMAELRATAADWSNLEFSPDGQRIAMDIRAEGQTDIWGEPVGARGADARHVRRVERAAARVDSRWRTHRVSIVQVGRPLRQHLGLAARGWHRRRAGADPEHWRACPWACGIRRRRCSHTSQRHRRLGTM